MVMMVVTMMVVTKMINDNDGDDIDDEDKGRVDHLRHVPQEPHHVAQQIGFLRESFFALPGEKLV